MSCRHGAESCAGVDEPGSPSGARVQCRILGRMGKMPVLLEATGGRTVLSSFQRLACITCDFGGGLFDAVLARNLWLALMAAVRSVKMQFKESY